MNTTEGFQAGTIAFGCAYAILGFSMCLVNVLCAVVYASYPDYRTHVCYRILLSCSVCDAMQLFGHGYGGLVLLTGTAFHPWIEKILGGILNANSMVLFVHQALLAMNRFVVVKNMREKSLASEARMFVLLICVAWTPAVSLFAYVSPFCGIVFLKDDITWDYADLPWSSTIKTIDFAIGNAGCAIALLFYVGVVIALFRNRRIVRDGDVRRMLSSRECHILVQSLATFASSVVGLSLWYFAPILVQISPSLIVLNTFMWLWINCTNSTIYLVMNKQFRMRFIDVTKRAFFVSRGQSALMTSGSRVFTTTAQTVLVRP